MENCGFQQNATNYVKHSDGLLQMCHDFSFKGNIRLFFKIHGCEITFYDGPVFEEKFLKYIMGKWEQQKESLVQAWNRKYDENKSYILNSPEFYTLNENMFAKRSDKTEIFSPNIFPILSFYDGRVKWWLTDSDFNKMGFEYSDSEEKATYYKHTSKNLGLAFTSVGFWISDKDNKRKISIEKRVYHECKTLEVLRMLNLLNHVIK